MGNPIRIGFLMHGIFYGGATRSLNLLLRSLSYSEEFEFYIYTISIGSEEVLDDLKQIAKKVTLVNIKQINYNQAVQISLPRFLIYKKQDYSDFVEKLIKDKIDILHINTSVFPNIPAIVKNKSNIKVITHVRELIYGSEKTLIGKYVRDQIADYSDKIIVISDNEAAVFKNSPKIEILPNPFDFSIIKTLDYNYRAKEKISGDTVLVMMSSHFYKPKGHLTFLCALKKTLPKLEKNSKVSFLIVGVKSKTPLWKLIIKYALLKGDYRSQIIRYIKRNKLENHIKLIPYTKNIFEILSAADIVVRPAYTADPWGRDIIEAMAFSKPVIATGTSEFYIRNGKTGYLVSPKNCDELSDKIIDLIYSIEKRKAFGQQAAINIREKCNIEEYGKKMSLIYKNLLNV